MAQLHPANLPYSRITLLLKVKDISTHSPSTCFSIPTLWSHPFLSCRIWLLMCVHSWKHLSSFACRHDSVVLGSLTEGLLLTCGAGHGGPVLDQHPLSSLHHGSLLHVDRTGRHRTQNSVKTSKSKAKAVMISFSSFCYCSCCCNDAMLYIRDGHKTLGNPTIQNQRGTLVQPSKAPDLYIDNFTAELQPSHPLLLQACGSLKLAKMQRSWTESSRSSKLHLFWHNGFPHTVQMIRWSLSLSLSLSPVQHWGISYIMFCLYLNKARALI